MLLFVVVVVNNNNNNTVVIKQINSYHFTTDLHYKLQSYEQSE